jgi:CBS domain-containing protein
MTKNVVTVQEDASLIELRKLLCAHRVRHLPVLNQEGTLVGLLSVRDVLDQFFGLSSQIC